MVSGSIDLGHAHFYSVSCTGKIGKTLFLHDSAISVIWDFLLEYKCDIGISFLVSNFCNHAFDKALQMCHAHIYI